jgi:hypothetical protein
MKTEGTNKGRFGTLARVAAVMFAVGLAATTEGCDCNNSGPSLDPNGDPQCHDCPQYAYKCLSPDSAVCAPDGPSASMLCPSGQWDPQKTKDCSGSWGDTGGHGTGDTGGLDETVGDETSAYDCSNWDLDTYVHYDDSTRTYLVADDLVGAMKLDPMLITECDEARMKMVSGGYYEFYNIAPGDLADVLGFKNGDILLEVNRHDLVIPEDYQSALVELWDETEFTAEVSRGGQPVVLLYEVL